MLIALRSFALLGALVLGIGCSPTPPQDGGCGDPEGCGLNACASISITTPLLLRAGSDVSCPLLADPPNSLLVVLGLHAWSYASSDAGSNANSCATISGCVITVACGHYPPAPGGLIAGTEVVGVLTASGGTLSGAIIITTAGDSGPTLSCIYDVTASIHHSLGVKPP
jgi:hypothetical protein